MKKRKHMNELPTMTKTVVDAVELDETNTTKTVASFRAQVPVLTISIPYLECERNHWDHSTQTKRFDAGRLTREDWETIHAIRNGFSTRGDVDKYGRTVDTPISAFRMLLAEVREFIRKTEITEAD